MVSVGWLMEAFTSCLHSECRLAASELPDRDKVLLVVEEYFANIHPLRCYGFIHKPSFIQRLNEGLTSDYRGNALLLIICALGAKQVSPIRFPVQVI